MAAAALALATLAACTSSSSTPGQPQISVAAGSTTTVLNNPSDSTPPSDPAAITAFRGHDVSPIAPIKVSIANGKLTDVTMVNAEGKHVRGKLADDGSSWQNSEVLGYSKTYRITATGVGDDGSAITKRSRLTTLTPNNMTMPYIQTAAGGGIRAGATFGVGRKFSIAHTSTLSLPSLATKARR